MVSQMANAIPFNFIEVKPRRFIYILTESEYSVIIKKKLRSLIVESPMKMLIQCKVSMKNIDSMLEIIREELGNKSANIANAFVQLWCAHIWDTVYISDYPIC